jgi:antitoxin VapB
MALHIRDAETDVLVRELARRENVSLTEAVKSAVVCRLKMLDAKRSLHDRLSEFANEIARAPKTGKKADKKFFGDLSGH